MSMDDVILVATVREEIRGGVLRIDVADIPHYMTKTEAGVKLAKLEAETKATADAEVKTKAEAKAREKYEADAKAKAEAQAREKGEAEGREKREAKAKSKAEVDATIAREVTIKAAKEVKVAAVKAELDAKQKAEKERLELKAETARAEAEWRRVEAEKADLRSKQAKEQIARRRTAEKAARAAANTSASDPTNTRWGGSRQLSEIATASAIIPPKKLASPWNSDLWSKRYAKNTSSAPSTELGPLRGPGAPSAPTQYSSTTSSPHGSASTHLAVSINAAPSSATVMWQERKLTNDKLDGRWFWSTMLFFDRPYSRQHLQYKGQSGHNGSPC